MVAATWYKVVRGFFIFFNFIGIAMGIAMIAVGAYLYIEKKDFLNIMPKYEDINIAAVMVAAGIILLIIACIGFCGAWMESQCMLIMFFTAIFIIFAMEIAIGIVGFIYRGDIDTELNKQLKAGLKEEKRHPSWDTIQKLYKCCGVDSYEDWYAFYTTGNQVPDSCCNHKDCGSRPDLAYSVGCYSKVKSEVEDNFYVLGAAGITLGVLQILLLVMTMLMICAIRQNRSIRT
ncbi:tetraspanin-9-like [Littorina saxatilis]|uniref:Tetraspanin n=1 Tax=Littorina saxatilis TaxID=31220 RepID=A0AAN9B5C8_9CAEN